MTHDWIVRKTWAHVELLIAHAQIQRSLRQESERIAMECHRLLLVLFLLPTASYGWWIFSSSESGSDESSSSPETRRPVQFEMTTAEQKFLAEAQTFLDLPQLDQCQHVVSAL